MFRDNISLPSANVTYLFTYLLTYLLTPCSRVLLENLTDFQLVKEFPAFYGTRLFITAFTRSRHLALSWVSSIQSIPHHIPLPVYPSSLVPNYQARFEPSVHDSQQNHCSRWEVVSTSPTPQAGGPHRFGRPRLRIQYIRSYSPYWRPFLHPQPEDAPCCGDRDPLIVEVSGSAKISGLGPWRGDRYIVPK